MANFQQLSNLVWNVADDVLRGLFKQHEYGDITLPFLVLRRLDCILQQEDRKNRGIQLYNQFKDQMEDEQIHPILLGQLGIGFYNTSQYDLSRLKDDPNNIRLNFNNYLQGFSPNVREMIDNFNLDGLIERLDKNDRLFIFCDKFTEIDLHPELVPNHMMGQVFEELLRRFAEMSNETSGQHYTPRDVVRLLVSLLFAEHTEQLGGAGVIRNIFDPCCGTGGMLTIGKEYFLQHINPEADVRLLGQELNAQTHAICKSDMLITGQNPDDIKSGSSLSNDQFMGDKFDYMITNPPFGVSWKSEEKFVKDEVQNPHGRFTVGTPRTSDGALLFLQHLLSKMEDKGSRICIVFNGSPLFTGDAGSGESEIRRWIIENDWLEGIVALPDQLFFNTGISTYIWVLTNNKSAARKGKVQLVNAVEMFEVMRKSLGSKRKSITEDQIQHITDSYTNFVETEDCKIYPNQFFGYTKVTVERPLKEDNPQLGIAEIVTDRRGNAKPDTSLRDTERIPLTDDVDQYYQREVEPHVPDSWMDRKKDKVGYEINFTKYFYKYQPLRSLQEIEDELLELEIESEGLLQQVLGLWNPTQNTKTVE